MKDPKDLATKRVVRYVRCSTSSQDTKRQLQSTEDFAHRNGFQYAETYQETGRRHEADKRLEYQRLLAACRQGEIDAIVIDRADRFFSVITGKKTNRKVWSSVLAQLNELSDCKVELWIASGECLTEDDQFSIMRAISYAEQSLRECVEKGYRTITGKRQAALKGQITSGHLPPYGCDVLYFDHPVTRVDQDQPLCRAVYLRQSKWEIHKDGKVTLADRRPTKRKDQYTYYAPSVVEERIETVRTIFQWLDEESISPYQVARRANDRRLPSYHQVGWRESSIRNLATNPVYIGLPSGNRSSKAQYFEIVNGDGKEVEDDSRYRQRDKSDWWQPPSPMFDPIVDVEVFERVYNRVVTRKGTKSNRDGKSWLGPFLYCAGCNQHMNAKGNKYLAYCCSSYRAFGAKNPHGCKSNSVRALELETIVKEYLESYGKYAEWMNDWKATNNQYDLGSMAEQLSNKMGVAVKIQDDMLSSYNRELGRIKQAEMAEGIEPSQGPWNHDDVAEWRKTGKLRDCYWTKFEEDNVGDGGCAYDLYGKVYDRMAARIDAEIEAKQKRIDEVYSWTHGKVTGELLKRMNNEVNQLAEEIKELEKQREPLHDRFGKVQAEIDELRTNIENAKAAMSSGKGRAKTRALERLIDKIVLTFEPIPPEEKKGKKQTRLAGVEIIPAKSALPELCLVA